LKSIFVVIAACCALNGVAHAATYEVAVARAVVRESPSAVSAELATISKGHVVDGTIADSGWLQIVLEDGSKGYLFLKILKPAGPKATPAPVVPKKRVGTKPPLAADTKSGLYAGQPASQSGVNQKGQVIGDGKVLKIRGVEAKDLDTAKKMGEELVLQQKENERLHGELDRLTAELKAAQNELRGVNPRLQALQADRARLISELQTLSKKLSESEKRLKQIYASGKDKMLSLADTGEAVMFKGVGEAQIATADGRAVLRFPLSLTRKADMAFLPAGAEKYQQGQYVYYVLDSSVLSF